MVAAALFGDRHLGRARLQRRLAASKRGRFFRGYLDTLVVPMLHLFFDVGLMFEPHLQNVLVSGFDGAPPRVFLRDFDNCKVVDGIFAPERLAGVRPEVEAELRHPRACAWDRLVYCLFVNNLAEVMIALADGDTKIERTLVREAAAAVASFRDRSDDIETRRALDALLAAKTLPAKANLLTRAFKHKDREAPFVAVPNPLREGNVARGAHPSPSAGV
jgi:siderophore synthetase component